MSEFTVLERTRRMCFLYDDDGSVPLNSTTESSSDSVTSPLNSSTITSAEPDSSSMIVSVTTTLSSPQEGSTNSTKWDNARLEFPPSPTKREDTPENSALLSSTCW